MIKLFGDDDQAAIEEHNRRDALAYAAGNLDAAADAAENAQGLLSEVPLHMEDAADELQPIVAALRGLAIDLRRQINRPERANP